jgi:hypothetical protein
MEPYFTPIKMMSQLVVDVWSSRKDIAVPAQHAQMAAPPKWT